MSMAVSQCRKPVAVVRQAFIQRSWAESMNSIVGLLKHSKGKQWGVRGKEEEEEAPVMV